MQWLPGEACVQRALGQTGEGTRQVQGRPFPQAGPEGQRQEGMCWKPRVGIVTGEGRLYGHPNNLCMAQGGSMGNEQGWNWGGPRLAKVQSSTQSPFSVFFFVKKMGSGLLPQAEPQRLFTGVHY